ncbi:hypothetical protein EV175_002745 [Coemansia sp. RSA 1933]|nr:hypothetical protein EV175_002745 [Coemansia sp. RSA 1933]
MAVEESKAAMEPNGLAIAATAKQSTPTAPASESPIGSNTAAFTASTANLEPNTVDNVDQRSSDLALSTKPPRMLRTRTDTPTSSLATQSPNDPLAEVRARLKKKQSSPTLPTASGRVGGLAARAAFLEKASSQPTTPSPPGSGSATPKKQPKSVRNLVAMFEHT